MNFSKRPLRNFPLLRSRDIEEAADAIGQIYVKPVLEPVHGLEGFNAVINNCQLINTGLTHRTYGVAVKTDIPATAGFVSLLLPIRGKAEIACGRTVFELTAGTGLVHSSDMDQKALYSDDYALFAVHMDSRALAEKLAAMTGVAVDRPLRIEPQQSSRHPTAQAMQQYLPMLVDTLDEARPPLPKWWIAQTEQFLMMMLLSGYQHNYSHLLEDEAPDAALQQVRRAEEYIEANAERSITLEELAEVTGVSVFSLFKSFRKLRGYSPLAYLSRARFRRHRQGR
jgi:hypothetical protein